MLHLNISLTTLAVVLWSGMLIISGSIWVLASQVRKVAEILELHGRQAEALAATARRPSVPRDRRRSSAGLDIQGRLDEVYTSSSN